MINMTVKIDIGMRQYVHNLSSKNPTSCNCGWHASSKIKTWADHISEIVQARVLEFVPAEPEKKQHVNDNVVKNSPFCQELKDMHFCILSAGHTEKHSFYKPRNQQ
jgi:hypothetical protein